MPSKHTKGGSGASKSQGTSATDSSLGLKKGSSPSSAVTQSSVSDRATAPAPSVTERKPRSVGHGLELSLPPMPTPCNVNEDIELRVLCFNIWGIFNSKKREARMRHFAHKIKNYDLILLQEQFNPNDFEIMKAELSRLAREDGEEEEDFLTTHGNYAAGYYFQRFRSGFYGCGLAVISRFPIVDTMFHCFPLQGYPERILHGDFFANKGAALVKVAIPLSDGTTRIVHSYTTHLVATYEKISRMASYQQELYLPFRLSQALSFAQFISLTSRPDDLIIVGGDFNANQYMLEVRLFLATLKLQGYKLTSVLHPVRSCTSEREGLHTVSDDNAFNYSKTSYFKLLNLESDHPSQIDHIFYNYKQLTMVPFDECPDKRPAAPPRSQKDEKPSSSSSFSDYVEGDEKRAVTEDGIPKLGIVTMTLNNEVPLEGDADSSSCPLSDHYAVAAKFLLNSSDVVNSPPRTENSAGAGSPYFSPTTVVPLTQDEMATLDEAIAFLSTSVDTLRQGKERCLYVAGACAAFMLAAGVGVGLLAISHPSAGSPHSSYSGLGDVWHLSKRLFFHTVDAVAPLVHGAVSAVSNSAPPPPPPPRKMPPVPHGPSNVARAGIVAVTTVSHVFCALSGMAALAAALMGVIHRQGNASLLEEQLRQLVQTKKVNTLVRRSYEDPK